MKQLKIVILFMSISISVSATSAEERFTVAGIKIGNSYADATSILAKRCENIEEKVVNPVTFPLAKVSEKHIICKGLTGGGELAAVIADEKVVHVYGLNVDDELVYRPGNETKTYLGYDVYRTHVLWKKKSANSITLIRKDALHPNLFVWKNPFIGRPGKADQSHPLIDGFPPILKFGSTLEKLRPVFQKNCDPLDIVETDVWLVSSPKTQIQVNCYNYYFLGFPRKIEAVFGDNILELAWILTAKQEEPRMSNKLTALYGSVQDSNDKWDLYHNGRVYLRKDKPEVLAVSKKLAPLIRNSNGFE